MWIGVDAGAAAGVDRWKRCGEVVGRLVITSPGLSVIIGLIFIGGGLTGNLTLIGTNSGPALAVVGALILGRGLYRLRKQRAQHQPL